MLRMCVDSSRSQLFGRADFFAVMAAAALPFAAAPGLAEPAKAAERAPLPVLAVPSGLRSGNARAARIAAASPFVRETSAAVTHIATSIADSTLRASVLALLADPRPAYAQTYPTPEARIALRDALVREGFVATGTPLEGIFPPGTEAGAAHAPQPFWATAGSGENSHHSYPGGLAVHEYSNATMAATFASTYDRVYFNGSAAIDRDIVVGAALYHDIMKAVVFQWNDDGTLATETTIAATGAHHVLSGAEAIVRGRSPRFVTALLSAHAAPSLGDESKVADWCRAAALIAGVDPIAYGLLKKTGSNYVLTTAYVPIEAFVNYLSDHDYALSIHAVRAVLPELRRLAPRYPRYPSFAWFKNEVLAHHSAIGLYGALARGGTSAFDRAIAHFAEHGPSAP